MPFSGLGLQAMAQRRQNWDEKRCRSAGSRLRARVSGHEAPASAVYSTLTKSLSVSWPAGAKMSGYLAACPGPKTYGIGLRT